MFYRNSTDEENNRIDCYPERLGNVDIVTKEKCEERNCIYNLTTSMSPSCYYKPTTGYRMTNFTPTKLGTDYHLTWQGKSPFGSPIQNAILRVEMRETAILRIKVSIKVFLYSFFSLCPFLGVISNIAGFIILS